MEQRRASSYWEQWRSTRKAVMVPPRHHASAVTTSPVPLASGADKREYGAASGPNDVDASGEAVATNTGAIDQQWASLCNCHGEPRTHVECMIETTSVTVEVREGTRTKFRLGSHSVGCEPGLLGRLGARTASCATSAVVQSAVLPGSRQYCRAPTGPGQLDVASQRLLGCARVTSAIV